MKTQFRDRDEAGRLLAEKLTAYANRPDVLGTRDSPVAASLWQRRWRAT